MRIVESRSILHAEFEYDHGNAELTNNYLHLLRNFVMGFGEIELSPVATLLT